jgi:hypothetical protein
LVNNKRVIELRPSFFYFAIVKIGAIEYLPNKKTYSSPFQTFTFLRTILPCIKAITKLPFRSITVAVHLQLLSQTDVAVKMLPLVIIVFSFNWLVRQI